MHVGQCPLLRQQLPDTRTHGVQAEIALAGQVEKDDFAAQWNAGNRGEAGDWRA